MNFNRQPILENDLLILRPLKEEDFENLYKVASDPLIWEQHPAKNRSERTGFEAFFKEAIESQGALLVIDKGSADVIGSSRFFPVKDVQNAIEIGWTFLARKYWGGEYNKSMKTLMMNYAYGYVDNIIFCIHEHNIRSQKAVENIGGQRIIELENQVLMPRDKATVIYNIRKP